MNEDVLVVLINYNGLHDTLECLESLRSVKDVTIHTLVLDNGSSDSSEILKIQAKFPEVCCVRSDKNLGFAAGCNYMVRLGLQQYLTDFVLLLNNDTIVDPLFLSQMVKTANSDTKIGIVGPKVLYYAEKNIIQTTGGMVFWWLGYISSIGSDRLDCQKFDSRDSRDWAPGCGLLAKREVIEKIGFLNEFFFQGGEDYEYSHRAISNGYKVIYEPRALMWHKVSKSTRRRLKQTESVKSKKFGVVAYMNIFCAISPHPVLSAIASVVVGFPVQMFGYLFLTKDRELKNHYRRKFLSSIGLLSR